MNINVIKADNKTKYILNGIVFTVDAVDLNVKSIRAVFCNGYEDINKFTWKGEMCWKDKQKWLYSETDPNAEDYHSFVEDIEEYNVNIHGQYKKVSIDLNGDYVDYFGARMWLPNGYKYIACNSDNNLMIFKEEPEIYHDGESWSGAKCYYAQIKNLPVAWYDTLKEY